MVTRTGEWEISAISWRLLNNPGELACMTYTGKINRFPFLGILGYLKNTHKNPKFGKVRQVPTGQFPTKSLVGTCLALPNLGFTWVFFNTLKYPISFCCFFLCYMYFIKLSEHLAKKLIGDTNKKFLFTNTLILGCRPNLKPNPPPTTPFLDPSFKKEKRKNKKVN